MAESELTRGVILDLDCPYFACFRQPTSTSVVLTYPVPPFTTLRGLLANALGLSRNDFSLQEKLWLGVRPLRPIVASRELAKVLKFIRGKEKDVRSTPSSFPSSPMHRSFLVQPAYRVYLSSEDYELLDALVDALRRPRRPLYLGQSDDVVVVQTVQRVQITQVRSRRVHSMIGGIYPGCELLKLPLRFEDENTLVYTGTLSLPPRFPWELDHEANLWDFAGETVWLIR